MLRSTMSSTFTISELAREFEVTTRTIRFYEDQGLLSPKRSGTTRVFSPRDRVRLKLALRGKRLGFTIAEIRELFELYDVSRDEHKQLEEFLSKLERRRARLEQQREDIEVMLREIDFFAGQCRRLLRGDRTVVTPDAEEDMHERAQGERGLT
jgi:DNA-binding transcriptional MerR regulator